MRRPGSGCATGSFSGTGPGIDLRWPARRTSVRRVSGRREGPIHKFALAYAACFPAVPHRIIYCEHGNQCDPANAIADYADPLDAPLGHHIVTNLTRRIVPAPDGAGGRNLRDVNQVYPLVAIPELLAGQLLFDLRTQIGRWLLLPRSTPTRRSASSPTRSRRAGTISGGVWESDRSLFGARRLFLEIGYNAALLLSVFAVLFVVIRRLSGRFVASTLLP